jgi:NADH-quinone oxidoreductase subunit N
MLINYLITLKQELVIVIIICLLLLIKIAGAVHPGKLLLLIRLLLFVNLAVGFFSWPEQQNLFGGLYQTNALIAAQKNLLNAGVLLIALMFDKALVTNYHLPEYFVLMLSALLGLHFLVSSQHLLLFYLSLELATLPLAALVNFDLQRKRSSEAAVKFILNSAFSSGLLLMGISLVYGASGSLYFADVAKTVTNTPFFIAALVWLLAAFAFKLSVAPFHLWTADVYEGAPVSTTVFLAVVSKAAFAFAMAAFLYQVFPALQASWEPLLMALGLLTLLLGNLFAIRQQNIKRFLAYSSIAQMGFVMLALLAGNSKGTVAIFYFMLIYLFSNLVAFAVVAAISWQTGKENIADYKALYRTNPLLCWLLALSLFSLAGVPPTAGFFGKLFLIAAGAGAMSYWFLIVVVLNLVIALYYYLRVVKAMFFDTNPQPLPAIAIGNLQKACLLFCIAAVLLLGFWGELYNYIATLCA